MEQTKIQSIIESITQTTIGLVISLGIQLVIYPLLKIPVTFSQNLIITTVFFLVSFVRNYLVRRFFNKVKK